MPYTHTKERAFKPSYLYRRLYLEMPPTAAVSTARGSIQRRPHLSPVRALSPFPAYPSIIIPLLPLSETLDEPLNPCSPIVVRIILPFMGLPSLLVLLAVHLLRVEVLELGDDDWNIRIRRFYSAK